MTSHPKFSVVIPSRNRHLTLPATIRTCLDQNWQDLEVIVFDNGSGPETRAVVDQLADARLRYIRQDSPLPMTESWNRALSHTSGEWVIFIGDDDGLTPNSLATLAAAIDRHAEIRSIRWLWAAYTWPGIEPRAEANLLRIPISQREAVVKSRERLLEMLNSPGGALVPHTYHALMKRSLIDEVQQTGEFFEGPYPDVASGAFAAMLTDTFLELNAPMSFLGYSPQSTTLAQRHSDTSMSTATEFAQLNESTSLRAHPDLPDAIDISPITYWDALYRARDRFAPDDPELTLPATAICQTALDSIVVSGVRRKRQIDAVLAWWNQQEVATTTRISIPDEDGGIDHEVLIDTPLLREKSIVVNGDHMGVTDAATAGRVIGQVSELTPVFEQIESQLAQLVEERESLYSRLVQEIENASKERARLNARVATLKSERNAAKKQLSDLKAATPLRARVKRFLKRSRTTS